MNGTHSSEIENQTFAQRIYTGQLKKINMLDIKGSADYLSRSTGSFSNFSMLFAGNNTGFLINLIFFSYFTQIYVNHLKKLFKKIRDFFNDTFLSKYFFLRIQNEYFKLFFYFLY